MAPVNARESENKNIYMSCGVSRRIVQEEFLVIILEYFFLFLYKIFFVDIH